MNRHKMSDKASQRDFGHKASMTHKRNVTAPRNELMTKRGGYRI